MRFCATAAEYSCSPSIPACSNIRRPLFIIPLVFSAPIPFLNTDFKRSRGISSDNPTPAPNKADFARCCSVAPASLARSLASPAPAPTAKAPPATGFTIEAPSMPPKDPRASENLRGMSVAPIPMFMSGAKKSCTPPPIFLILSRTGASIDSGSTVAAPNAPCSNSPATPLPSPLNTSPV